MADMRTCIHFSMGKRYHVIFHCWTNFKGIHRYHKDGDLVALIEYENGKLAFVSPDTIHFTDTQKQLELLNKTSE